MTGADTLILIILLVFAGLGLYWGFIRQILSFIGLIAGVLLAIRYGGAVAEWLSSFVSFQVAQSIGFLFVMIAVSSIASLIATVIRKFAGLLFLGWLDSLGGAVIGLIQGALACAIGLAVLAALPNDTIATFLGESSVAPGLIRLFSPLVSRLPDVFRDAAQLVFQLR